MLDLSDPGRSRQTLHVAVDAINYAARFDAAGQLHFEAPLLHPTALVTWDPNCKRTAVFERFETAFLTAIVWDGPYDLALHVVEPPDGRIGGPRHYISPSQPNTDLSSGAFGMLQEFGDRVPGTSRVQLYTLPDTRSSPANDVIFYVEFKSRGNPARPPFCGSGEDAVATFDVYHVQNGRSEHSRREFDPVSCGFSWDPGQPEYEYMRLAKWKVLRNK